MRSFSAFCSVVLCLFGSSGCWQHDVTLRAVGNSNIVYTQKLPGDVAIDLTDLGVTRKKETYQSFVGSALVLDVNLRYALSESILNFSRRYFHDAFVFDPDGDRTYDYLLKMRCSDMRWWANFDFKCWFEIRIAGTLFKDDDSVLWQSEVKAKGSSEHYGSASSAIEAEHKAGEDAMRIALHKAFEEMVSTDEIQSYARQVGFTVSSRLPAQLEQDFTFLGWTYPESLETIGIMLRKHTSKALIDKGFQLPTDEEVDRAIENEGTALQDLVDNPDRLLAVAQRLSCKILIIGQIEQDVETIRLNLHKYDGKTGQQIANISEIVQPNEIGALAGTVKAMVKKLCTQESSSE